MKKVGIFGGTFDPIHIGHLIAAEQAVYHAKLDEIWFMPALQPPHKMDLEITSVTHRVEMVNRVVQADSKYKLCNIELERNGPSYTLDTMKELRVKYSNVEFYFIIGGDMIKDLHKWYGIEELINIVQFLGLERPGFRYQAKNTKEDLILQKVKIIPMPQLEISSSLIRDWVKIGRTIRYLVPQDVNEYIREKHLYES